MSVKLIDNEAFYGFRVRRRVDGTLYQEYFSLKKKHKRLSKRATAKVKKQALSRDEDLQRLQRKIRQQRRTKRCFRPDGSVRGIYYLENRTKRGSITRTFRIMVGSSRELKNVCRSVSISKLGKEDAWRQVIETYAYHKRISKNSKLYRQLLASMDATLENQSRPKRGRPFSKKMALKEERACV